VDRKADLNTAEVKRTRRNKATFNKHELNRVGENADCLLPSRQYLIGRKRTASCTVRRELNTERQTSYSRLLRSFWLSS